MNATMTEAAHYVSLPPESLTESAHRLKGENETITDFWHRARLGVDEGGEVLQPPAEVGTITESLITADSFTLSWVAVDRAKDMIVDVYDTVEGVRVDFAVMSGLETTYTATGLKAGRTYTYHVYASNAVGWTRTVGTVDTLASNLVVTDPVIEDDND